MATLYAGKAIGCKGLSTPARTQAHTRLGKSGKVLARGNVRERLRIDKFDLSRETGRKRMLTAHVRLTATLLALGLVWTSTGRVGSAQAPATPEARIKIDIDRTIGEIDARLFGNFAEHL